MLAGVCVSRIWLVLPPCLQLYKPDPSVHVLLPYYHDAGWLHCPVGATQHLIFCC